MDPVPPEGLLSPTKPLGFGLVTGLSRLRGSQTRPQHDAEAFLFCGAEQSPSRGTTDVGKYRYARRFLPWGTSLTGVVRQVLLRHPFMAAAIRRMMTARLIRLVKVNIGIALINGIKAVVKL